MRPTSRPAAPSRSHGTARQLRPRWVPRLATPSETGAGTVVPLGPAPENDRGVPPGHRFRPRVWAVIAVVVLVEVLLVAWVIVSADDATVVDRPERLVAPRDLPLQGSLVLSQVRPDGSVAVTQWMRGLDPLGSVALSTPTVAGSGPVQVTDARLVADDGSVLAEGITVGAEPQRIPVEGPTRLVRATYVLDGVSEVSSDVPGRLLVQAVAVTMASTGEAGPVVVEVEGAESGAVVRNLACSDAGSSVAVQRPCGSPDGSAWQVRLNGDHRDDVVTAQVDLP